MVTSRSRRHDSRSSIGPASTCPRRSTLVVSGGASIDNFHRTFASLRLRYFGPRPLVEDNSVRSKATTLLNLRGGISARQTAAAQRRGLQSRERRSATSTTTSRRGCPASRSGAWRISHSSRGAPHHPGQPGGRVLTLSSRDRVGPVPHHCHETTRLQAMPAGGGSHRSSPSRLILTHPAPPQYLFRVFRRVVLRPRNVVVQARAVRADRIKQ